MSALDNDITRDLYNAGVSHHAFTLLVNLARAYKHASDMERETLECLNEEGAHLYYDPDGYMGEPVLILHALSGNYIDPEEAGVNNWFNAVKPLILDEVEEHGEVVPVNRPEILSALAFMNFGLYQWTHRLPIIPENWMLAMHRAIADGYMVNVVRHLNGEWPNN